MAWRFSPYRRAIQVDARRKVRAMSQSKPIYRVEGANGIREFDPDDLQDTFETPTHSVGYLPQEDPYGVWVECEPHCCLYEVLNVFEARERHDKVGRRYPEHLRKELSRFSS